MQEYEWLHLHHEDFTGQYSKFYITYAGAPWLEEEVARNEEAATGVGLCRCACAKEGCERPHSRLRRGRRLSVCDVLCPGDARTGFGCAQRRHRGGLFGRDPARPGREQEGRLGRIHGVSTTQKSKFRLPSTPSPTLTATKSTHRGARSWAPSSCLTFRRSSTLLRPCLRKTTSLFCRIFTV